MDPKMDSGYLAPGETLEDDYDVSQDLTPEQVLGIMDALFAAEVAWLKGHPLSQTLFTSIYIDHLLWPEPTRLEDASFDRGATAKEGSIFVYMVLRSYCIALIKSCDFVHRAICAETYYEVSRKSRQTNQRRVVTIAGRGLRQQSLQPFFACQLLRRRRLCAGRERMLCD